jgi:hypothetical protein
VPIDPRTQDFFKIAIEERKRLSRRTDLSAAERDRLDLALKIIANAGAYGIFAQFDRHVLPADVTEAVLVYGGRGKRSVRVAAPEEPGSFAFPPLAACITSAARLMLALAEQLVSQERSTHVFCDTDSMAVPSTEQGGLVLCPGGSERLPDGQPAIQALSWAQVEQIRDRFAPLNPYDPDAVPGSILRLEKVNFDPLSGARRQVHCYAISAKRYVLLMRGSKASFRICDKREHGLGLYVNPTEPDAADREWIDTVWKGIVTQDAFGQPYHWPDWVHRPAATQLTVSAPSLLRPFKTVNAKKSYADQVKPFNFLVTVHVAPNGHPPGVDPAHFHLIPPGYSDANRPLIPIEIVH